MRRIRKLLLPTLFLFLLSCGTEDSLRPESSGDGTLLKEVKIGGETYYNSEEYPIYRNDGFEYIYY